MLAVALTLTLILLCPVLARRIAAAREAVPPARPIASGPEAVPIAAAREAVPVAPPRSAEGLLVARLAAGELTRDGYRHAMARLAASTAGRHATDG